MKTILKYFLVVVAVLAFAPMTYAQYVESNGVALNKKVDGPKDGQYTITLEAFTTGEVTVSTGVAPADIVLVLDYSNSMNGSRIASLRTAAASFIDNIVESNGSVVEDDNGGHRIGLIIYSANVRINTGLVQAANLNKSLLNTDIAQGTGSGRGMRAALGLIQAAAQANQYIDRVDSEGNVIKANSKRSRIVVFFTDGRPGNAGTDTDTENPSDGDESAQGTLCITCANSVKNTYGGTVYSVGLFGNSTSTQGQESTFLSYTSSDYTGDNVKTAYATSAPWVSVSDKYSFLVKDTDKLKQIFDSISQEAGQSGASLGESSTVTVDVLSASFTLPPNADKSKIKTYTAKCVGAAKDNNGNYITFTEGGKEKIKTFLFDEPVATAGSALFSDVEVDDSEFENDIISVKGFDYEENYCAIEKNNGVYTNNAVGYKLVIEIPIIINPNSVGGPNTATNDPQSGVYLTDDDGNRYPTPVLAFNQPTLPVPVNLIIRKLGLNKGESAKFVVQRADAYDSSGKLIPVSQATWSTFEQNATWTPMTTFVMTGDGNDYVEYSMTGLSDKYYYRILEEDGEMIENANWSWSYTSSALTYTNSYQQLKNPFIFENSKGETTRKHAESVVTNKFQEGATPVTVDSREFFKK